MATVSSEDLISELRARQATKSSVATLSDEDLLAELKDRQIAAQQMLRGGSSTAQRPRSAPHARAPAVPDPHWEGLGEALCVGVAQGEADREAMERVMLAVGVVETVGE